MSFGRYQHLAFRVKGVYEHKHRIINWCWGFWMVGFIDTWSVGWFIISSPSTWGKGRPGICHCVSRWALSKLILLIRYVIHSARVVTPADTVTSILSASSTFYNFHPTIVIAVRESQPIQTKKKKSTNSKSEAMNSANKNELINLKWNDRRNV